MFELENAAFKKWLEQRQQHFNDQDVSLEEIATRAIKHGFPVPVVRQWEHSQRFQNMGKRP